MVMYTLSILQDEIITNHRHVNVFAFCNISSLSMLLYIRFYSSIFNLSNKHGIKLFELSELTNFYLVKYQAVNLL